MLLYCPVHVRAHPIVSARTETIPPSLLLVISTSIYPKENVGTVNGIVSMRGQGVDVLQDSQSSVFEPFAVTLVVAGRRAADFRSLLNASYFW
jgi:hypothetical protein